jgi:hypothetical protein
VYIDCNFKVNGAEDSSEGPVNCTTHQGHIFQKTFCSNMKIKVSRSPHGSGKFVTDPRALYSEEITFHSRGQSDLRLDMLNYVEG